MTPTDRTEALALIRERCVDSHGETERGKEIFCGRPVRLADVLLALNSVDNAFIGDWVVNTRGHFCKHLVNGQNISQAERWDLYNDDLESQDDSTILFISGLLK